MKQTFKVTLAAGSRPGGVPQFSSEAERCDFERAWAWLLSTYATALLAEIKFIGCATLELTLEEAQQLEADVRVLRVEPDRVIKLHALQLTDAWGLARIVSKTDKYEFTNTGRGVKAYVVDSGIEASHPEFEGRVTAGFNIDPSQPFQTHHGTHVAGIIGSKTFGVAKKVQLVDVRVFVTGTTATSNILQGLQWIEADHAAGEPAVVNLSLGSDPDTTLDDAVQALITDGLICVVSAGNDAVSASLQSPARLGNAITVAATDAADDLASFSNFGPAVDILAPGVDIVSTSLGGGTRRLDGTSMATPFVVGVAACYLEDRPSADQAELSAELIEQSQKGVSIHGRSDTTKNLLKAGLRKVELSPTGAVPDFYPTKPYRIRPFLVNSRGERVYGAERRIGPSLGLAVEQKLGVPVVTKQAVRQTAVSIVPGANPEP